MFPVIMVVVIGVSTSVTMYSYGWVNSCAYVDDERLSRFVGQRLTPIENIRDRIEEEYKWFVWDLSEDYERRAWYWTTPFKSYSLHEDREKVATGQERFLIDPTINQLFRCLGEPSYYEAFEFFDGIGSQFYFRLWYPDKGMRINTHYMLYHNSHLLLRSGFSVDPSTVMYTVDYFVPGTMEEISQRLYVPPELENVNNMDRWASNIRQWEGLEAVEFYVLQEWADPNKITLEPLTSPPIFGSWRERLAAQINSFLNAIDDFSIHYAP